jgi:hypothetical protein
MKFVVIYSWKSDTKARDEGMARFRKTGGQPPAGVELLGRWTHADLSGGFALVESNDPEALAEFAHMWSDLMELRTVPVVEDRQLAEVLKRVGK